MLKEMLGIREGILETLHKDHEEVADLIERILAAKDSSKRNELFKEMKAKLIAHSEAESKVLYRKMQKVKDEEARHFAFEGDVEHGMIEEQLEQLSKGRAKDSEQWTARMTVLKELVTHHVEEEESEGFSNAREEFDSEELRKLDQQFQREKEKLL
jgi:hemerythrin-like domain-containing protein